mgnify:CR=1 FL=1
MERRLLSMNLEETSSNEEGMKISGTVNAFNWSKELGFQRKFIERIEPQAFINAINRAKENNRCIECLFNHQQGSVMASTKNNSLELNVSDKGLEMRANLCDTNLNRDVYAMIQSHLVDSFSFGFTVLNDRWEKRDGKNYRVVTDLDLFEISCVYNPAYTQTELYARSLQESEELIPDDEKEKNTLAVTFSEDQLKELSDTIKKEIEEKFKVLKKMNEQSNEKKVDLKKYLDQLKKLNEEKE